MHPERLPIHAHRGEILDALRRNQVIVLAAETGAGKTTQVPQYLYEAGYGREGVIGVTQPRKVAAMSVAAFVAEQMGCRLGTTVGYQIRHERVTDHGRTRVKFMTDGILLREALADPHLRAYGVLVLDEMHERNLNQDFILALVKQLLPKRPDLKVVVMSATINERAFADYFGAEVIRVPGRTYPIEIEYLDFMPDDEIDAAVESAASALRRVDGDVMVFMPDYASIDKTMKRLAKRALGVELRALYGNQSPEEQRAVFDRRGRRIIVATNIAETSITLDGVGAVVDTGLIKQMAYRPQAMMSSLQAVGHSRAGCDQRAGRSGRTAPGLCLRLYTHEDYESREAFTEPEILRSSIEQVILQMKAMGLTDAEIDDFGFLDAPPRESFAAGRETLHSIGAIDGEGDLTDDGRLMSEIPLPPIVSRMILSARAYGCVAPVITIAATFSTRSVFVRPRDKEEDADKAHARFRDPSSDFLTALNAVEAWKDAGRGARYAYRNFLHSRALEDIEATEHQLREWFKTRGIEVSESRDRASVAKSVASGLLSRLLVHNDGLTHSYQNASHPEIYIHPGSSLFSQDLEPQYLVATEIVETTRVYARMLQAVSQPMLRELIPPHEIKTLPLRYYVIGSEESPTLCCEAGVSWKRIRLGITYIEDVRGPEVLLALAKEIVASHTGLWNRHSGLPGIHFDPSWHPHVCENIWVIRALRRRFPSFKEPTIAELASFYAERLHGVESIEEALACDLKMDLTSSLNEADRAAFLASPSLVVEPALETGADDGLPRNETVRLGELVDEAVEREAGRCPLCGRKLFSECRGPHDQRRLLFAEPTCVILSLGTDSGQEIARLIVHKTDGRVELQKNRKLIGYIGWRGKPFTKVVPKRREDAVVPFNVTDLDGFLSDLKELKTWRAEAEGKKAAAADLKKEIAHGRVARLTFAAVDGRSAAQHRGTTYYAPYDEPYPQAGETWYCRLVDPLQGRPTATPLFKQAPSADEEEALVAEMSADLRRKYGFAPSL